jgi:hypothetical protein
VGDPSKKVELTPVNAIMPEQGKPLPTMESLKASDPARYAMFKTESDRVDAALTVLIADIDKKKLEDDAFRALQKAENVRDESPEAYEAARVGYYSMIEGPEWIEKEKDRVSKVDVAPEIQRYKSSYKDIATRQQNQERTQDVMKSVKDGVLTMKDDFKYTTGIFKEQIDNLKNQINIERRGREKPQSEATDFYKWLDALLNLFIIAGLLYAVFVFWRKLGKSPAPPAYAPAVISTQ